MNSIQNENAVRCPECGFRKLAEARSCPRCGTQQSSPSPTVLDWDNAIAGQLVPAQEDGTLQAPPVVRVDELAVSTPAGRLAPFASPHTSLEASPQPAAAASAANDVTTCQGAAVVGRVIAIDTSQREPPDLDICRVLTKILWALLALASPLLIFGHTLVTVGPLLAIGGVAGVLFLARLLPVTNILWFAYLAHANRRADEQVPVWYARVRTTDDKSEVMVRLKGLFSRGNVATDDLVGFWGSWRDGVLMASHGYNQRTQTAIQFRRSIWWLWLLLTLILATAVAIHFHDTWVTLNNMVN